MRSESEVLCENPFTATTSNRWTVLLAIINNNNNNNRQQVRFPIEKWRREKIIGTFIRNNMGGKKKAKINQTDMEISVYYLFHGCALLSCTAQQSCVVLGGPQCRFGLVFLLLYFYHCRNVFKLYSIQSLCTYLPTYLCINHWTYRRSCVQVCASVRDG